MCHGFKICPWWAYESQNPVLMLCLTRQAGTFRRTSRIMTLKASRGVGGPSLFLVPTAEGVG